MTTVLPTRPELVALDQRASSRVRDLVDVRGGHCAACGATDFTVGAALWLGFLFLDEADDAYLVALTCANPDCPLPRTAVRLRRGEFLR